MSYILSLIHPFQKTYLIFLVIFTSVLELIFFAAFTEIINIYIFSNEVDRYLDDIFQDPLQAVIIFCICSYLIKLFFVYKQHFWSFFFSHKIFMQISTKLLRPINLLGSKDFYVDSMMNRLNILTTILIQTLQSLQACISILLVTSYMCYLDWLFTLSALIVLVSSYLLLIIIIQNRLTKNSIILAKYAPQLISAINYFVSSGRQLKSNAINVEKMTSIELLSKKYRTITAENMFISSTPRLLFECVILLSILLTLLLSKADEKIISFLVLSLIAAQRILPYLQIIYQTLTLVRANIKPLSELLEEIKYQVSINEIEIDTKTEVISLVDVKTSLGGKTIRYRDINIEKSTNYVLTGESGSGKTVLLDIFCGLRTFEGTIKIDGKLTKIRKAVFKWTRPCMIYKSDNELFHSDIKANIFYNKNAKSLATLLKQFNLEQIDKTQKNKFSMGQQQRLLLIRSLADISDSIFWDEPTSALDRKNQILVSKILNSINQNKFCLISSHNPKLFQFNEINVSDYRVIEES